MTKIEAWLDNAIRCQRNTSMLVIVGPRASGKTTAIRMLKAAAPGADITTQSHSKMAVARGAGQLPRLVTSTDVVVIDKFTLLQEDNDALKSIVTAENVTVERIGQPNRLVPIKANIILLTDHYTIPLPTEQRVIIASPLEVINALIPFLAR